MALRRSGFGCARVPHLLERVVLEDLESEDVEQADEERCELRELPLVARRDRRRVRGERGGELPLEPFEEPGVDRLRESCGLGLGVRGHGVRG